MPCNSDHLEPTAREQESTRVRRFLREIGCAIEHLIYGRQERLDQDTDRLCDWCRSHDVSKRSLELADLVAVIIS